MQDQLNSSSSILEKNCREEWPVDVCIFANICGLTSAVIWFIVLFPQLWKNFRRKSVRGLSLMWAIANFTASLVNLFFVFKLKDLPTYTKIQAVYQPTLELAMLVQFWIYGKEYTRDMKLVVGGACLLGWGVLVTVQLTLEVYEEMEWIAIVLWSVEAFPQVMLNLQMQSTGGQATNSVLLSLIGKTTDFLSTYLLLLPLQYVIMAYFSSSMCYINGLQVIWYWGKEGKLKEEAPRQLEENIYTNNNAAVVGSNDHYSDNCHGNENVERNEHREEEPLLENIDLPPGRVHLKCAIYVRIASSIFICMLLIGCVVGLMWNTHSAIAVLAPVGIAAVLVSAYCFFYRCGDVENVGRAESAAVQSNRLMIEDD